MWSIYEPKAVNRAFREEVPEDEETFPIDQSEVVREGQDLTFITYGAMLRPTLDAADALEKDDGVKAEVIDLLTIIKKINVAKGDTVKVGDLLMIFDVDVEEKKAGFGSTHSS